MIPAILILLLFTFFGLLALISNLREKNYWMLLISAPLTIGGLGAIAYVYLPAFIGALSVFAGAVKAVNHVSSEWDLFANSRLKNWEPNYWVKGMSYLNKYHIASNKPRFFGSTTFLVWTTDGWHLTNMLYAWLLIIPAFLSSNLYELALVPLLSLSAGHFTYEYLTKPRKNET